jgi:F0F1-type ATP synthase assembly protein I
MLTQLEEIKETLFKYFETRIDLFKIETRDRIERAVVMAVYAALTLSIALVIFILAIILLGTFLNKWLHSDYLGYLILFGFFVLKLILWIVFREKFINLIRSLIVRFVKIKED